jgi:hypothetical protein
MSYKITIGTYSLIMIDSILIKKSVEQLSDTADIILPGVHLNKAINIESKLQEGDQVSIQIGYDNNLYLEFKGYLNAITTDNGTIKLECEDDIYLFRKQLKNIELKNISAEALLKHVVKEINSSYKVSCSYEFKYDKFLIKDASGWDILKKIQDETKANIYFKDGTLHIHPQYSEIFNEEPVVYDFAVNIEKSNLKYKTVDQRKYQVEVEGIMPDGKRITTIVGTPGGEKRSIKVFGVSDINSLKKRAKEELQTVVYTGYEGSFTGWLVPYCEPGYAIKLQDAEYPKKDGKYYVVATDTKFSSSGGERTVTIGKKIG